MTLTSVGDAFLVLSFLAALAFPVLYRRSPWYESTVGRDAMTFSIAITAILALSIAVRIFGLAGEARQVFAAIIYVTLAVLLTRRVVVLWQLQQDPHGVAERDARRDAARRDRAAARRAAKVSR